MLTLDQVSRNFGGLTAVNHVSFDVQPGQIMGLIGPNGAGKTTLLNLISGLDQPTSGAIHFNGQSIHNRPPHVINQLGIARTYQNIRLFAEMSVLDNVVTGTHPQGHAGLWSAVLMLPAYRAEERRLKTEAQRLIERLGLNEFSRAPADALSYGDQRRTEIARALATRPHLLLLDEPTAGMNAAETARLGELILSLRDEGLTVLVIEHDMTFIAQVCDQVVVLNFGEVIARGTPDEIKANPIVVEAYLGVPESAMLKVTDLTVRYGAIEAVHDLSFEVAQGQAVAIIGANGAGKSTTLNTIGGLLKPARGRIELDGRDITGWRADQVARLGLAQVPEGREVLAPLTVEENLRLGAYPRRDRSAIEADLQAMYDRFPVLAERRKQPAGFMSGGEQQMLAVARALMARPKLLTLDEPSMGLAPLVVNQIFDIISEIKSQGVTLLLVEQNAHKALKVADYAYVLERGQLAHATPAAELRNDPRVVAAYLG